MRALVTGGAGFIGHHLVAALLARGDEVAVLDDYSTGLPERLVPMAERITSVVGDLRDRAAVDQAVAGCDVVFHQAALPSVARSVEDPRLTNDINTNGTIEVMLGAARARVGRLVFAGSSSVYGNSPELPRREVQRPDPQSPYAASKLAAESYVHTLGALHGISTVVLRYFNIFGPGQDPSSQYAAVVPIFVTAAIRGEAPTIHGDGLQSRDFTYVDNAVSANLLAADTAGVAGLTANIGCGRRYTILDLWEAVQTSVGRRIDPVFGPARKGDVIHSLADIELASERLAYRVLVPFDEGVRRTVAGYLQSAHVSA